MAEQLVIGFFVTLQRYGLAQARFELHGTRVVFIGQVGALALLLQAEVANA